MSNPTEFGTNNLPDLDKLEVLAKAAMPGAQIDQPDQCDAEAALKIAANPAAVLALIRLARRAKPEGEAPQADALDGLAHVIGAKAADFREQGLIPWQYQPTDAQRYARLRVLGAAPVGTPQLSGGTVLRFQGLDDFIDADIAAYPSRGECTAQHAAAPNK